RLHPGREDDSPLSRVISEESRTVTNGLWPRRRVCVTIVRMKCAIALLLVALPLVAEEGFMTGADGVRLHYAKAGRGKPVLIIPGELFLFDDFKQLGDQATVIAYDMRNRGRSEATPLDKIS